MIFQFSDGEFSDPIATSLKMWKKINSFIVVRILHHFREIEQKSTSMPPRPPGLPPNFPSRILLQPPHSKTCQAVPEVTRKTFGDRAFFHAGRTVWNALPSSLRNCRNIESFKVHLKTYLFKKAFNFNFVFLLLFRSISSVKRWFGKLFQSLTILTKKQYLKELTLANLVCILFGWLARSSVFTSTKLEIVIKVQAIQSCSIPLQIGILIDAEVCSSLARCIVHHMTSRVVFDQERYS